MEASEECNVARPPIIMSTKRYVGVRFDLSHKDMESGVCDYCTWRSIRQLRAFDDVLRDVFDSLYIDTESGVHGRYHEF